MTGDTVIITGGTKGLGRATTLEFAKAGHPIIAFYATDEAAAETLRTELRSLNSPSVVVKHDVSQEDTELWDRLDITGRDGLVLINNAFAAFTPKPFHLLGWHDFDNALTVGLKGSWLCAATLLKCMVRKGSGTIVNVLTKAIADTPPKGFAAYVTAKHALRGLTLALAAEYSAKGIRVFSVSPGFMLTSLTAGWDARLLGAIRNAGPHSNPSAVAHEIRRLTDDAATRGHGENYPV